MESRSGKSEGIPRALLKGISTSSAHCRVRRPEQTLQSEVKSRVLRGSQRERSKTNVSLSGSGGTLHLGLYAAYRADKR